MELDAGMGSGRSFPLWLPLAASLGPLCSWGGGEEGREERKGVGMAGGEQSLGKSRERDGSEEEEGVAGGVGSGGKGGGQEAAEVSGARVDQTPECAAGR